MWDTGKESPHDEGSRSRGAMQGRTVRHRGAASVRASHGTAAPLYSVLAARARPSATRVCARGRRRGRATASARTTCSRWPCTRGLRGPHAVARIRPRVGSRVLASGVAPRRCGARAATQAAARGQAVAGNRTVRNMSATDASAGGAASPPAARPPDMPRPRLRCLSLLPVTRASTNHAFFFHFCFFQRGGADDGLLCRRTAARCRASMPSASGSSRPRRRPANGFSAPRVRAHARVRAARRRTLTVARSSGSRTCRAAFGRLTRPPPPARHQKWTWVPGAGWMSPAQTNWASVSFSSTTPPTGAFCPSGIARHALAPACLCVRVCTCCMLHAYARVRVADCLEGHTRTHVGGRVRAHALGLCVLCPVRAAECTLSRAHNR